MTDYNERVEDVLKVIRKNLDSAFSKNLWDPLTPEERRNIEAMCKESLLDPCLRSLGYNELDPYGIICDERNNSPEDIENGVINVTIIPPISAITVEFLLINEEKGNESH